VIAYLDASALVKRYVIERGSRETIALTADAELTATSIVSRAEVAAALGKAARIGLVTHDVARNAQRSFASDWPVAELDPVVGIQEAVTRRTPDGAPSPHRLSIDEAIDCYTRRAAYACRADDTRGTLTPRKYADLVILSKDLFEIPRDRISEVRVLETVVGGRSVYRAGGATKP